MKKKVISIFTSLAMLCSLLGLMPTIEVSAAKRTPNEIVAVANELYNTTWTPLKTIYGYGKNSTFEAGKTYRLPYGMPVNTMTFIGFDISINDFISQTKYSGSKLYTSNSGWSGSGYKNAWYCPYYAMDCSSFVGYCWGIPKRQDCGSIKNYCSNLGKCDSSNVGKLQIGDALVSSGHIVLVTNIYDGKYEITEETPPQLTRNTYTSSQLVSKYSSSYSILRYADVPPEPSIPEEKPVDVGTDFCAYIINIEANKPLSADSNNNVWMKDEPNCANQVWKFTKQNDGSYEIINCKTRLALDSGGSTDLRENLYTYEDCDNDCQRWYIFGEPGAYHFKSKYKDQVIDIVEGGTADGTNAQMFEYNGTTAQKFSIYKLDAWSELGFIEDVGTNFCAYIINTEANKPLSADSNNNVLMKDEPNCANQVWKFTKQNDGSYEIINCKTGLALDAGGGTDLKENLYTYNDCDNDCQRWYIFGEPGAYYLKSKYKDHVIDIAEGSIADGTNAQMYNCNKSTAQKFTIYKLEAWSKLGCIADIGTDFYAYITSAEAKKHLTNESDNNVSIRNENGTANQIWKFTRQADGSYKIINCKTGLALDSGGGIELKENLYTYDDCDNDCQRWYIFGKPDAYYLKSKYKDHVIDIAEGSTADGTNAQMFEYNDTTAQKFSISKLDKPDVPVTTTTTTNIITTTTITTTTEQLPVTTTTSSTTTNTNIIPVTTTTTSTTIQLPITTTTQTETTVPKPIKTNADLNADGKINAADIVEFQKIALKKYNDIAYIVDLNGDGVMNVFDMILLRRMILKG